MERYSSCDHHELNSDKNLLLDDENAILINDDYKQCTRCIKTNTIQPLFNNSNSLTTTTTLIVDVEDNGITPPNTNSNCNWMQININNKCLNNPIQHQQSLTVNRESRLSINSINSTDSIDAPLLLNNQEQYEFNNIEIEDFHCHLNRQQKCDNKALRRLLAASGMCLFFMATEIVGGYLANSVAAMTDAAHLMSDFIGFLVSLFSIWIGQKSRTKRMSFGYHRAEVLGALFSIVVVWMLTGIFIYVALFRLIHGKYEIKADAMIIVASIGVFINIVMGLILHGGIKIGGSQHNHSHSHDSNINLRAAVIHVLGDLIQSLGVLCAAIIIKFYPSAKIADPICTFIFSIIVIFTTKNVLRDTITVLMEGLPRGLDYNTIHGAFASIEGVRHVHGLHIWSLTLNKNALTVHLAVDKFSDNEEVLIQATRLAKYKFSIQNATIQIEKYKEDLMGNCVECQQPKD